MCYGCSDNFDLEKPDANQFVLQLKDGTYNEYYLGEKGEKLWTIFPKLSMKDIPLLATRLRATHINPRKKD